MPLLHDRSKRAKGFANRIQRLVRPLASVFRDQTDRKPISRALRLARELRDDDTQRKGFSKRVHDRTPQKMAEEVLRESEERLRLTQETAGVVGWEWNLLTSEMKWSGATEEVYGRTPGNFQEWFHFIKDEDKARVKEALDRAIDGNEPYSTEFRYFGPDGDERWLLGRATVQRNSQGEAVRMFGINININRQKHREEELRRTAESYRVHFELSSVAKAEYDFETHRFSRVNQKFCEITGYSRNELLEISPEDLTHPEDKPRMYADHMALATGKVEEFSAERRYIRKDGQVIWVSINAGAIHDESGRVVAAGSVVIDMTERRQMEEQLRRSEELFKFLANSIPQLAWMADASGWIFWYNQRWYDYTGTTIDSMKGWGWTKVHHPDHVNQVVARIEQAFSSGEPWEDTFPLRSRSGEWRWFLSRALPLRNKAGAIELWFGTNTDVTKVRELEETLRSSEKNFRLLAEASPQIVWTADPAGNITYFNSQWFAYTGRSLEADGHPGLLDALHPDDSTRVATAWKECVANRSHFESEHRYQGKNGMYQWFLCRALPVLDETGVVVRWLGSMMNIEEQKRVQEELAQAKLAAEDANRAKSVFLSMMSHEIRTPLGAIVGFGELIQDEGLSPEDRHTYADAIYRNGRELTKLIDDILDLSKVEAGELLIEHLRVNLPELLADVVTTLMPKARAKGIDLLATTDPDVPDVITSDPTRLRQILLNIAGNAVKFTDSGRVSIHVKLENHRESGASLSFLVKDTGAGISPDAQERLFRPFSQAEVSTTRKYGGTGLGLDLSRKLARAMGGDVKLLESYPGEGSTFLITMDPGPIQSKPHAAASNGAPQRTRVSKLDLKGVTVLVADDSPDNRMLVRRILRLAGATVEEVDNGAAAVESALAEKPDLVLMDMQMPVLDGYNATEELRRRGYDRPIVALTAYAVIEEREKSLRAGCNDQLTKPIDQKGLVEMVSRYVEAQTNHDGQPMS